MWTSAFWKDAGTRAIRTFAQTAIALLTAAGVTQVVGLNLIHTVLVWAGLLAVAAFAGILSLLESISGNTTSVASLLATAQQKEQEAVGDMSKSDVQSPTD